MKKWKWTVSRFLHHDTNLYLLIMSTSNQTNNEYTLSQPTPSQQQQQQDDDLESDLTEASELFSTLFSTRKPKDGWAGVSSGLKSVTKGTVAGVASLIAQPIAGAQENGVKGFFGIERLFSERRRRFYSHKFQGFVAWEARIVSVFAGNLRKTSKFARIKTFVSFPKRDRRCKRPAICSKSLQVSLFFFWPHSHR